jgi:hypothetical protein
METYSKEKNKIGEFIHEAFCVDGKTNFLKLTNPTDDVGEGTIYKIENKKRGTFFVGIFRDNEKLV